MAFKVSSSAPASADDKKILGLGARQTDVPLPPDRQEFTGHSIMHKCICVPERGSPAGPHPLTRSGHHGRVQVGYVFSPMALNKAKLERMCPRDYQWFWSPLIGPGRHGLDEIMALLNERR